MHTFGGRCLTSHYKRAFRRRGGGYRQSIEMERSQFLCHEVGRVPQIVKARCCAGWKLGPVFQSRIEEGSLADHLGIRNIRIPVRHTAPSCLGMQMDPGEGKGGREHRRGRFLVWAKSLTIVIQFSIIFAGSPTQQNFAHRRLHFLRNLPKGGYRFRLLHRRF